MSVLSKPSQGGIPFQSRMSEYGNDPRSMSQARMIQFNSEENSVNPAQIKEVESNAIKNDLSDYEDLLKQLKVFVLSHKTNE